MVDRRMVSSIVVAVITAIGCGGSTPKDSAATTEDIATGKVAQDLPVLARSASSRDLRSMSGAEPRTSLRDVSGQSEAAGAQAGPPMQLAQAAPEVLASGGGADGVQGVILFEGTPPEPKKIKMNADPVCAQQYTEPVYSEEVVVSGDTLRHVFVYAKEGVTGTFPTPTEPVVLDQAGCRYQPHIAGIQVNQPLQIVNSDATLHNINAKPSINRPFNIAQPVKGMQMTKKFTKPEIMVKFKCNVHPWMNAYLGVLEHPFFSVSGEDGAFAIEGLPDGTYVIEAWHETYGTQTQSVTVAGGQASPLEFTFSAQ